MFRKLFRYVLLGLVLQQAGAILNTFVVSNNDDMMPVWCFDSGIASSVVGDPEHIKLTKDSKYVALTDIIPIPGISRHRFMIEDMMSVGDLLLFTGYPLFVFSTLGLIFYPFVWLFKWCVDRSRMNYLRKLAAWFLQRDVAGYCIRTDGSSGWIFGDDWHIEFKK